MACAQFEASDMGAYGIMGGARMKISLHPACRVFSRVVEGGQGRRHTNDRCFSADELQHSLSLLIMKSVMF
jgi:hypothetical protein